ncbi:MAG: protocatechuate 3,4-dioxygenase [Planctomycetota bacterium]
MLKLVSRRWLFQTGITGAGVFAANALWERGVFAEELSKTERFETPAMGEGPFYPDTLPLDTDNDLLILNDSITPAVGEITHLSGRVLSKSGNPVRNAFVEIWQVDHNGVYLHSQSGNQRENRDKNYQGYGRFLTDVEGRYYFRTIKPVAYPGRTPHIHVAVSRGGRRVLTTQLFVAGEKGNSQDGLIRRLDATARKSLMVDFEPLQESKLGELSARFDIVLGKTAFEGDDGKLRGVAPRQWG